MMTGIRATPSHTSMRTTAVVALLLCATASAERRGFLAHKEPKKVSEHYLHTETESLVAIERVIGPSFAALPKFWNGRINFHALKHLMHGYFMREHGWAMQGLDPVHDNDQKWDSAQENSPAHRYLRSLKTGPYSDGFELNEVVASVAKLEHLVMNEAITRLNEAYALNGVMRNSRTTADSLGAVMDSFLLLHLHKVDRPQQTGSINVTEHQLAKERVLKNFPDLADRTMWMRDLVRNFEFSKVMTMSPFEQRKFSFEDAAELTLLFSQGYGKFQADECTVLKDGLIALDSGVTGRVPLRKFYRHGKVDIWLLSEAPEYLRHLGVLDETGHEPQVLVTNYVNAHSNCDSPSDYYSICCLQECEVLLGHLDVHFGAPSAKPSEVLAVVSNLSSSTMDAPRSLNKDLVIALREIAHVHGGVIPLHGRLFAQWMHYAFPYECPYPQPQGKAPRTAMKDWARLYGDYMLSDDDVKTLEMQLAKIKPGTSHPMSQWTLEEELHLGDPRRRSGIFEALSVAVQVAICIAFLTAAAGRFLGQGAK